MNRREFLQTGAAGLAAAVPAPDKPLRVGLIGCGWYGKCDLFRLMQVAPVEVVSICDVDSRMLAGARDAIAARQPSRRAPRTYRDYREMLKEKDLEVVLVATPDHWHALPTIAAIQAGADVYVQKPISVDVVEGQAMVAAARKYGRVVQVGTQRRSTPHLVEARDRYIRSGMLGKIALVETYCCTPRRAVNPPDTSPPDYLDYELWTGPAPMRPYNPMFHPGRWRQFMEFGNGTIGDMGIHMIDMARWMLDLGWPRRISSTGGILVHKEGKPNISDTQTATFEFDGLQMIWQHRHWGARVDPDYYWGATFYGDKGTLKASVMGYDYIPLEKGAAPVHVDVTYELEQYPEDKTEERLERHVAPAIRRHMLDFLAARAKRGKPVADIEEGHISTAICILANIALETGRTFNWDPARGRVANDDEANRRLARPYRKPWVHPDPARV